MISDTEIIVAGHLCIDLIPRMTQVSLEALSHPGHLYEVGAMDVSTGGVVSNTGLALQRLGAKVSLLAIVGDDALGRMTIDFLNARDQRLAAYVRPAAGVSSSYSIVLSPERVDRIFLHCPGANDQFYAHTVDLSLVNSAKIVHFGYPPLLPRFYEGQGEELVTLFQQLKTTGVVTSMDMTLPDPTAAAGRFDWRSALEKALPSVDIFIPSFEESVFMLRRADFDKHRSDLHELVTPAYVADLIDELLGLGVAIAGVKCGAHGIMVKTGTSQRLEQLGSRLNLRLGWASAQAAYPAFDVQVAGTTGAGDSAYAGFLSALLKGHSLSDCVRWACAVGACNVEAADATSGVRSWDETALRLQDAWPTRTSRLVP